MRPSTKRCPMGAWRLGQESSKTRLGNGSQPPRRPTPKKTSTTAGKSGATSYRIGLPTSKSERKRSRTAKAELEAEAKAAAEAEVKARADAEAKRQAEGRKKPGKPAAPPSPEPDPKD